MKTFISTRNTCPEDGAPQEDNLKSMTSLQFVGHQFTKARVRQSYQVFLENFKAGSTLHDFRRLRCWLALTQIGVSQ